MTTLLDSLKEARSGVEPWAHTPKERLIAVGKTITSEQFPELVALLDDLSKRREEIERDTPGDGDATDDVHFAQQEIFTVLDASRIPSSVVVDGLKSPFSHTRFWVSLTLKDRPDQSVVFIIRAALQSETDVQIQKMLCDTLDAWSLAEPAKSKSWLHNLFG